MSLPACEQRVLNRMEESLRASEPRLAAMYTMFARLNAGEPVGTESLSRARWLRPRPAVCAMVLVPAVFAVIVTGALLSSTARGATGCGTSQAAIRGGPMLSRPSCPPPRAMEAVVPGPAGARSSPEPLVIRAAHGTGTGRPFDTSCQASPPAGRPAASDRGQQAATRPPTTGPPVAASGAC